MVTKGKNNFYDKIPLATFFLLTIKFFRKQKAHETNEKNASGLGWVYDEFYWFCVNESDWLDEFYDYLNVSCHLGNAFYPLNVIKFFGSNVFI